MPSIKIVLRGGGTRYPVYIGAFKELAKSGFKIEEALGTSAGAIAAGMLASGQPLDRLHELTRTALPSTMLDPRAFPFWPFVDGTSGVIKGDLLLKFARDNLPKSYQDASLPLHISTHNWTRGENRVWISGDLPLHVRASMSLPIFDMVQINGDYYEDGGVSGNFLLDYEGWIMRSSKQTPVIGLSLLSPGEGDPRPKPKNKLVRVSGTMEDMINAADREHIEDAAFARVVYLKTKHSGLEFGMTAEDVDDMVAEGERGMAKGLAKIAAFLR